MAPPDVRAFRDTIGAFTTGVTVLMTGLAGDLHAMTANAITSVSLDPVLVLACIARTSTMAQRLDATDGGFAVNVLTADQQDLADWFAGRSSRQPAIRFEPWAGTSRLAGCLAALACAREAIYAGGDHQIVVGRVVAAPGRAPPAHRCCSSAAPTGGWLPTQSAADDVHQDGRWAARRRPRHRQRRP